MVGGRIRNLIQYQHLGKRLNGDYQMYTNGAIYATKRDIDLKQPIRIIHDFPTHISRLQCVAKLRFFLTLKMLT